METVMAWNEPGDGKDPWGGKSGSGGPPDLDEALKKFWSRINKIFGSGGGTGKKSSGEGNKSVISLVIIVALVGWAVSGFYQVDEKEQAVVLRLGKYIDTMGPGLHWNPTLIDKVTKVRVTEERQYSSQGQMLTEDENIVELPLTVQYNISDVKAFVLNVKAPELSLRQAADAALRHVVGSSKLDEVVSTGRLKIGDEVQLRLQTYLDNYGTGIKVRKINIQEAKPPSQVKAAYDDVIKAREDKERLINEAQTYSNGIIPEARGQAQRQIEEANGYLEQVVAEAQGESKRFELLLSEYNKAPQVTRQRIYLDTMEKVMGNSTKVLVDVEGGNNMLYLPLDKIMESSKSQTKLPPYGSNSVNQSYSDQNSRQNSARSRSR
tara:strand:- start:4 stop:1140 length:1137 start_codon:yes stop_codon:yes gene_type:complete